MLVNAWNVDEDTKTIKIFDPDTGRELRSFSRGGDAVAFSPDGRRILTNSYTFEFSIGNTRFGASYATLLDSTTGRTVGTIGYGPLNVGAKAYKDMQEDRFLGNTANNARNEAILNFITSNGYATRAEVDTFFRNAIRQEVTAVIEKEFTYITFTIRNTSGGRNGNLRYTPGTGIYVLSYGGFNADENTITAPAPGLPALLSELRRNRDFDEAGIRSVEENAATIPYLVYADRKARGEADALALITDAFVNFYTNSTVDGYNTLLGINARYALNGGYTSGFASGRAMTAYEEVLLAIFPDMGRQISSTTINSYMRDPSALQTYSRYLTDTRYEVFGRGR